MSQETRRAVAFISSGFLLAGVIGFGVWQLSEPANFSTASQVHEAGHTQTTTVNESAGESTVGSDSAENSTQPTASQDPSPADYDGSAAELNPSRTISPNALGDDNGHPRSPQGTKNSRRAQIDAFDPYLPPHAVIQEVREPVVPTVVYRPRGFEGPQPDLHRANQGEPGDSMVVAEPAPASQAETAAGNTHDGSAQGGNNQAGNAHNANTPGGATSGGATSGASNKAAVNPPAITDLAPNLPPELANEIPNLQTPPLLDETLDIAGVGPNNAGPAAQPGQSNRNQQPGAGQHAAAQPGPDDGEHTTGGNPEPAGADSAGAELPQRITAIIDGFLESSSSALSSARQHN